MRILYLSASGGGLDTNVRVLGPALVKAGHRVSILYVHPSGEKYTVESDYEGCRIYHTQIGSQHYYAHRLTLGLTSLPRIVRALEYSQALSQAVAQIGREEQIDLTEIPEAFIRATSLRNTPYIVRLHSAAWTWRRLLNEPVGMADAVEIEWERSTLRQASEVSSPSVMLANYIRVTCRLDSHPIEIIRYPVEIDRFTPAAESQSGKPPIILFVGRVERRKGADVLMQAMPAIKDRYPDCRFVFVGTINPELKDEVEALSAQAEFLGARPHAELVGWYQRATVFVAPSLWDNSPNTIYEAMACGTPVIASRVGGIPELVDDGVTGALLPPGDSSELAEALLSLLSDEVRRSQMSAQAREKAVREYSLDKIMNQTLDFYRRVLA
ncbi:phosphatidyl-myo-inositol dimannoside synthase [Anaerolineae bacterium]|nr:phosphatidyl-myo-inositol dimannoside synthase [Anaerolineae bacterium]